jgi:hypothetical protein
MSGAHAGEVIEISDDEAAPDSPATTAVDLTEDDVKKLESDQLAEPPRDDSISESLQSGEAEPKRAKTEAECESAAALRKRIRDAPQAHQSPGVIDAHR